MRAATTKRPPTRIEKEEALGWIALAALFGVVATLALAVIWLRQPKGS